MATVRADLLALILAVVLLSACAVAKDAGSGGSSPVTGVAVNPQTQQPPTSSPAVNADLVLDQGKNGGTFPIQVGRTVAIVPAPDLGWDLKYDSNYLHLVAPSADPSHPGTAGWLFRALKAGTTVVQGMSITPGCAAGQNCAGIPASIFQYTLVIE